MRYIFSGQDARTTRFLSLISANFQILILGTAVNFSKIDLIS
ncbi:MAG: hypothetical protein ACKO8W_18740 [Dolichospermum sp.]